MREELREFIAKKYDRTHGANPCLDFGHWHWVRGERENPLAALAHRAASDGPLYLETYLTQPIEEVVSAALNEQIDRRAIVEIGCLAAEPTPALIQLWCEASVTLSADFRIAVATLTRPLRAIFAKLGMPITVLTTADPTRLSPGGGAEWGSYYELDPLVCAGDIRAGCAALKSYAAGRSAR